MCFAVKNPKNTKNINTARTSMNTSSAVLGDWFGFEFGYGSGYLVVREDVWGLQKGGGGLWGEGGRGV